MVRLWADVGIVERFLHQPWNVVAAMPWTTFRRHVLTAGHLQLKEAKARRDAQRE